MTKKLILIFFITLSLSLFHNIHVFFIVAILSGLLLKKDELSYIDCLFIGLLASVIAVAVRPLHFPSIELFGSLFGGLSAWIMIIIAIVFTTITTSLLIKTGHVLINWDSKS